MLCFQRPWVVFLTGHVLVLRGSRAPECKKFSEIYEGGKQLCELMWDGSFKYETDSTKAYTMWFFDSQNPNDDISRNLGYSPVPVEDCHLQYFHKEKPSPEPETFTECHPWKDYACCHRDTVSSAQKLKESYGAEWHWDRCGPLSPECERFMVQEACFYECEPSAGLFRKFNTQQYDARCDPSHDTYDQNWQEANCNGDAHNAWQMHNMPIKASYCDAWYTACKNDYFCGSGSFWDCAAQYEEYDAAQAQLQKLQSDLDAEKHKQVVMVSVALVIGFVCFSVIFWCLRKGYQQKYDQLLEQQQQQRRTDVVKQSSSGDVVGVEVEKEYNINTI